MNEESPVRKKERERERNRRRSREMERVGGRKREDSEAVGSFSL